MAVTAVKGLNKSHQEILLLMLILH